MSKISCNVVKDLLASYLDGVCSEESGKLVEEHLQECASCRQFVEQIREKDMGADAIKVDFFKRARRSMKLGIWMGGILAVALIAISFLRGGMLNLALYYIAMPLLMLIGVLISAGGSADVSPAKKGWREWVIPVIGLVLVCAALCLEIMACGWLSGALPMPRPQVEMGPWLERRNICIAVLSLGLLGAAYVLLKGKGSVFVISQNLACLAMSLVLSCDSLLYHMEEAALVLRSFRNNIIILILEFAVMTVLMIVFCRMADKRRAAGSPMP